MRAPFQILVIGYRKVNEGYEYLILEREDMKVWQGVAGGGEDNEKPMEAAVRETCEELGINGDMTVIQLNTLSSIPACFFKANKEWGKEVIVIPEYSFGVDVTGKMIKLSHEHLEYVWADYETAKNKLAWDSNKTALYELNERLTKGMYEKIGCTSSLI